MGDAAVYDLAAVVAERDALTQKLKASEAEVAQIGSYCQTLTDAKVELAAELGEAQAEVALRKSEVELFRDKLKALCDEVAKLKAERDALKAEVAQADAEYQDAITLAQSNKDRLDVALAEVARLSAACAAKDAALSKALGYVDLDNDALISKCLAALKGTAGTNWIDATGAVEAIADHGCIDGSGVLVAANVPDDWAGATVKIVRVKP